jgi:hypothetical protein
MVHRVPNTFTLIDKKEHSWRRRILTQGFSDAAMRMFESDIMSYIQKLCRVMITEDLDSTGQEWTSPKNMADWSKPSIPPSLPIIIPALLTHEITNLQAHTSPSTSYLK